MRIVTAATAESEEHLDRLVRAERERAAADSPGRDVSVSAVPTADRPEGWPKLVTFRRVAARRRAHLGKPGDLDPVRHARLRARWFALRIRGVVGVLERKLG